MTKNITIYEKWTYVKISYLTDFRVILYGLKFVRSHIYTAPAAQGLTREYILYINP